MSSRILEDPRTASSISSIWSDVSEETFRHHLVRLEECTNAVPIDPQVFAVPISSNSESGRLLPIVVEQSLADDFAAIAAVEEGAQSVSAVCIEEHVQPPGLTIRFAAVDTITEQVQSSLQEVATVLSTTSQNPDHAVASATETLFVSIVRCHHRRILGRLRSTRWEKPAHLARSHKKPLWRDIANVIHRAQFLYTKREHSVRCTVESQLRELASVYESFESLGVGHDLEFTRLCELIELSYRFCTSQTSRNYATRLSSLPNITSQIGSALKCLHQIEKIAAYWRIPRTLVQTATQYPSLFVVINLEYLKPYASVPTAIAYESWAKTCHVHAEVQLAAYYDLKSCSNRPLPSSSNPLDRDIITTTPTDHEHTSLPPRTIGTSKYLCYLCHLFLTQHKHYHVPNTHGRLYDQWTIPDLSEYSEETRERYREMIKAMDREVVELTEHVRRGGEVEVEQRGGEGSFKSAPLQQQQQQGQRRWKAEPMTSRENLLLLDHAAG